MTFLDPNCLLTGTMVQTIAGEKSIESIEVGDLVQSCVTGQFRPVRWVGHRRMDGAKLVTAEERHMHLPVRIVKDAFAPGIPARDLYMSPGHAMIAGEYGIAIRHLINGTSIDQVASIGEFEYHHIEFDTHDGFFAENLNVESYFESDNRHAFDNAAEYEELYPGDDPRRQDYCVKAEIPLATLDLFRAKLNERAELLLAETV